MIEEIKKVEGMLKEDSCKGVQRYYLTAYYNSINPQKDLKEVEKSTNCDTVLSKSTRKIKNNCRIICKRRQKKEVKNGNRNRL